MSKNRQSSKLGRDFRLERRTGRWFAVRVSPLHAGVTSVDLAGVPAVLTGTTTSTLKILRATSDERVGTER